mmetsp:Transcript_8939/g.16203  ORF Transcript_8939/g.16203 Transcript_8939/m.16203 type:complete len:219 (+) Transcript_8939:583-1239(+)
MFLATKCNTTRHGTSQHFMSRHGNRVDWFLEGNFGSIIDKGHHHGKECSIAMNVITFARNTQHVENSQNAIQVIDGSLDCGSNIDIDDYGTVNILFNLLCQAFIINFSHWQCRNGLCVHSIVSCRLEDAIVRFRTGIQNAIGMTLARQQNAVKIAFGTARGDVTPILVFGNFPQVGKEINDGAFKLTRMHPIVTRHVGISEIINGILHEFVEFFMIVH